MKKRLLTAALAACLSLSLGCTSNPVAGGNSANGSLAMSHDDALLFAADSDFDAVFVIDATTQEVLRKIDVGRQPEKVLITPDDTVYVSNRLDRSVSVIRAGDTQESARIPVGVEPVGLAASSDGKTLYVVNATSLEDSDFGTLMAFDTSTLSLKWELAVGQEPRGITLMGDGKAAITLYKQGDLVLVDLAKAKVTKSGTGVFEALNASALGVVNVRQGNSVNDVAFPNGPRTSRPLGMEAVTVSPDGKQLYVASLLATDSVLKTTPGGGVDEPMPGVTAGYGSSTCGSTSVAAPALLTFDDEGNALVDDVATCVGSNSSERPPMMLTSPVPEMPVQGPTAITLEPTGRFLFIANRESNNVAVVATAKPAQSSAFGEPTPMPRSSDFGLRSGTVSQLVSVGAGPNGIAVTKDGKVAFVYNAFDHSVSRLESVNGRVSNTSTFKVTNEERLSTLAAAGRRLFFSAVDQRMNNPSTGISCATCHLEGREDGHVWNFPDGPRQTPSLQGRMLADTAPFHWNGEFNNLLSFMTHTVTNRMGGTGVTPAMEEQVAAFIASMPLADNPHANTPVELRQKGRAAFEKAECTECHEGNAFTDNTFADVGTFVTKGDVLDDLSFLPHAGLNTPSLLGLARTAPYLHDGSAMSLKARLLTGKALDKHGKTSRLSDQEIDDLVVYLKTL